MTASLPAVSTAAASPAEPKASPRFRLALAVAMAIAVFALLPWSADSGPAAILSSGLLGAIAGTLAFRHATMVLAAFVLVMPAAVFVAGLVGLLVR